MASFPGLDARFELNCINGVAVIGVKGGAAAPVVAVPAAAPKKAVAVAGAAKVAVAQPAAHAGAEKEAAVAVAPSTAGEVLGADGKPISARQLKREAKGKGKVKKDKPVVRSGVVESSSNVMCTVSTHKLGVVFSSSFRPTQTRRKRSALRLRNSPTRLLRGRRKVFEGLRIYFQRSA